MLLLAIDTSTTAITVALHDGDRVVAEETTLDARAHAEHLAPGIERSLSAAGARPDDVTDIVVGIGPGPFTGLRVGIVTGRTFGFALGLPVRGLCSLDALGHAAWLGGHRGELLVATDARRKEVYAARYVLDDAAAARVAGPVVDKAVSLPDEWRAMPTVGRGPLLYPEALRGPHGTDGADGANRSGQLLDVSAGALADLAVRRLAAGTEFDGLEPLYLRRPDVSPAAPTKSTLG
ncbi:MAG: tRNA (adenosine(37)-N6)-threonylcarbamoyltransferase complex dimerization subunit type 1 TsaB [Intrasporangium sp.]|uniref:tRNA (adenosine(37)-N6)-threonylcarbamoyltransferase complex dimerization subunit type 1 TsaB n=1 Tax=Intrasporangium sp. TaxID=1925024 RepID=UPI003F7F8F21